MRRAKKAAKQQASVKLTVEAVRGIPFETSGQMFYRDPDLKGFGLRVGTKKKSYFAESKVSGKTVRVTIGEEGRFTAEQARKKARVILGNMSDGIDPNHEKRKARDEAKRKANTGTTEKLLTGYVTHLSQRGKQSAQDVRNIFRRNVFDAFPHLAASPAATLSNKDASAMLAKLINRGAGRAAGKLRSYGHAAWAAALAAESDPTIHPDLHGFDLAANPWAAVPAKPLAQFNRARDRTLNESELGAFLRKLAGLSGVYADAIMLYLLLGGQRCAQLVRVKPADVNLDGRTITLYDPKGARQTPRMHVLPLTDRALTLVERLLKVNGQHDYLITSQGTVPVRTETLSAIVTDICDAMMKDKTARERFQMRDLRRTCETMLAAMGISRDVRAQLLSHGLGGVQHRHYDRHEYMDEKRRALEAWAARLEEIATGKTQTNIVAINRRDRKSTRRRKLT